MRTTIRLDGDLLVEIKQLAARSDRMLTSIIEDALREMLARQRKTEKRAPVVLPTVSGGGLQPASIWTIRPPCFPLWKSSVILHAVNVLVYAHREDTPNDTAYRE